MTQYPHPRSSVNAGKWNVKEKVWQFHGTTSVVTFSRIVTRMHLISSKRFACENLLYLLFRRGSRQYPATMKY